MGIFPKKRNIITPLNWDGTFTIDSLKSKSASLSWSTKDLKLFLPFSINNMLSCLGIWTKGSEKETFSYIGQLWKYIQIHRKNLSKENSILLGDFNSNSIWDKTDRWWNHTSVINELEEIGYLSLYHCQNNEKQGHESVKTFFHQKNISKAYHIDYVFCSKDIVSKSKLTIGNKENWLNISDHMPLIIEIKI